LPRRGAWISCAALALLAAAPVQASDGTSTGRAEISSGLTVVRIADLDFGTIIPSSANGRVTINRNTGACTSQAGATLVGSDCHRAEFLVTGMPSASVSVGIDPAPITLTRIGGGATMAMDQLRVNAGPNKSIGAAGTLTFYAGGRLQVGGGQMPGVYEATFAVSVDYQ
jgi:hypothetical protein